MGPADFAAQTGVSRETLERLETYATLLAKWQARINLVGPDTLPHVWSRHMLDSAQLWPLIPEAARATGPLVDLGSGAGFPGLVLAILGQADVHLIDSDARKGAFLREAARVTGARVTVHTSRIERVAPFPAAIVTARACAPLDKLLDLAAGFIGPETECLFLKGRGAVDELTAARRYWTIQREVRHASRTDPSAAILSLGGLASVRG
jgi:16S rRNA (guanine527-N7)-methyltransferase